MEVHVHRLFTELIAGNGTQMNVHPELDKTVFDEAQYLRTFSEENTAIHYERELIDIERPLPKSLFFVGTVNTDESPFSYSMPFSYDTAAGTGSESGPEWDREGHGYLVKHETVIRISMIVNNKVPSQAMAQIHYMQIFAMQALRNPPTQDWWSRAATLMGFTSIYTLPQINLMGFEEEEIFGKSFGARFHEVFLPDQHVALRKLT